MCLLELLRLCKGITAGQGFTGGFMFPHGLIPSLLVVVLSATRRATGWEAMGVLKGLGIARG
jgi:hypothetical protein